jgi:hypothetical protein
MAQTHAQQRWAGNGKSRTQQRIDNTLGIIAAGSMRRHRRVRSDRLERLQKYLEGRQYDHLHAWDYNDENGYTPVRKRKPSVIYPLPRRLCNTLASKLLGSGAFPDLRFENDPDMTEYMKMVVKAARAPVMLLDTMRPLGGLGSSFVRFFIAGKYLRMEVVSANHVYPLFDAGGELISARIQYTYFDEADLDEKGNPKEKWYRLDLSRETDILYDNPPVQDGSEPLFSVVEEVTHGFGFVQGEWFRTCETRDSFDGVSLIEPVLPFMDSINYSLSQADKAVSYSHEPQLGVNGLDEFEAETLIRSASRAWNLGREGKAEYIEANMGGVEKGIELRDKMRLGIQDITRVILLDPEKVVSAAQSGKAMEVMHGPLVELVLELRTQIEDRLRNVLMKMAMALLIMRERGVEEVLQFPQGWEPKDFDLILQWHPVFPPTVEDLQKKVSLGVSVANASLISRESITRYLAKDFGVENVEEEVAKITAQPVINPFAGGF